MQKTLSGLREDDNMTKLISNGTLNGPFLFCFGFTSAWSFKMKILIYFVLQSKQSSNHYSLSR